MSNEYKTINGLMKHLRKNGISINGSKEKIELVNSGYYHGYKGYRFFKSPNRRIPFTSYRDVNLTIEYDTALKSLIYGKIMFIETAMKNIALECILKKINSSKISVMFDKAVQGYHNTPSNYSTSQKEKSQLNKLKLINTVQSSIMKNYNSKNDTITHFYNNNTDLPIWALFEILTMGDFGNLLSCLTYDVRDDISKRLNIRLSIDTDRTLFYEYIYALKDLRNAVAHNKVIFDTRFRKTEFSNKMKNNIIQEVNLPYFNAKTIGDYIILISYFLKKMKVSKSDIKKFINEYEKITKEYNNNISPNVASIVIHPDCLNRMIILKNYI